MLLNQMMILISNRTRFKKRFLSISAAMLVGLCLVGCSSANAGDNIIKEMKDALNLYFSETKTGKIQKEKFFLDGALLFGMKAGDYDFRTLNYDFSDNSYFSLTYKEEFGYSDQKDIFNNKLLMRSPGYVGQVLSFPEETTTLDCRISFNYQSYTVSNTLKVTLLGGSEATAAATGWTQKSDGVYTYSSSTTFTDDIDRPTQKMVASGTIDLNTMTMDYYCKSDKYNYGLFSYTQYSYSYHYDASTGLIEITDNTNSYNIKNNSIYLNRFYDYSKYEADKANDWDWSILSKPMGALKTFDKLLCENNKLSFVTVFYSDNYNYLYLFGR